MKAIKPTPITEAMLISSSVPEADYAPYNSATSYALGARCIYAHRIYECVQGPSQGKTPDANPLWWANVAPTNRWAMLDNEVSSQTSATGSISVVIKPGYVNSLALFGLEGTALNVTVHNGLGGELVYSRTLSLDGTIIADWYQYCFEPNVQRADVVLTDLPPYGNAHITLTISGGGVVKCGIVLLGTVYVLGDTLHGATASITDYSRKDTSATGVTTFVQRKYSKRMNAELMLDNVQLNKVQRVLAELRATPCAWIGTDVANYEPLTVFGFYRDFAITVAYPQQSLCTLEIEGLT